MFALGQISFGVAYKYAYLRIHMSVVFNGIEFKVGKWKMDINFRLK